jgi:hypothetical protein
MAAAKLGMVSTDLNAEGVFTFAEDCVVDERTCRDTDLVRSERLADGSMVFIVEAHAVMRTQQVYVARFD